MCSSPQEIEHVTSNLLRNIIKGNITAVTDIVLTMVSNNFNIDHYNKKFGTTALLAASQKSNPKILQILIDIGGADVNQVSIPYDMTPLMVVSLVADNIKAASILIDRQADINKQNKLGQTALLLAALKYHIHIAKYLLESGADVNLQDITGQTGLMIAVKNNDVEMVNLFLQNKADFLHKNFAKESYRDYFTKETDPMIKKLLEEAEKAYAIHKLRQMRNQQMRSLLYPHKDVDNIVPQPPYQTIWNRILHYFGFGEKKMTQKEKAVIEYVTDPNFNPDIFYELMLMLGYPLPKKITKQQLTKLVQ